MRRSDFIYDLPQELIAQFPLPQRAQSRLLVLDGCSGKVEDRLFTDLPSLLQAGDLLVFNNTRVIAARVYGKKASGGKIELLVERLIDDHNVLAQIRASKAPKEGGVMYLEGGVEAEVVRKEGQFYILHFLDKRPVKQLLEEIGHMPLPPYIQRSDVDNDRSRYQTVYAQHEGAVAAPTAGLHFDENILDKIRTMGVETAFVTLHVGTGTFQPVRVENIADHEMHSEYVHVDQQVCKQVKNAKRRGRRVIAVGTTAVRSLETAFGKGEIEPFSGETRIFIYPGYEFRCVDAMITNFHMPESTLLMLVSAFAGTDNIIAAYEHAIEKKYRFFSYGDAMFLYKK